MASINRLTKRRFKFSEEATSSITRNPLTDSSLVSRGSLDPHLYLQILQTDESAREQLFSKIESFQDDHAIEHYLRKLREVIVSVFDSNLDDPKFKKLVKRVYQLSYEHFLERKDFIKLGNLVLNFMFHHFPADFFFRQLYALYVSHVESNLSKCSEILACKDCCHSIREQNCQLIRISSIYLVYLESPSQWFFILRNLLPKSQAQFLTTLPAFRQMKERTFNYIEKCYNQIPLDHVLHDWFYNAIDSSEIPDEWPLTTSSGKQTIIFKKRTRV